MFMLLNCYRIFIIVRWRKIVFCSRKPTAKKLVLKNGSLHQRKQWVSNCSYVLSNHSPSFTFPKCLVYLCRLIEIIYTGQHLHIYVACPIANTFKMCDHWYQNCGAIQINLAVGALHTYDYLVTVTAANELARTKGTLLYSKWMGWKNIQFLVCWRVSACIHLDPCNSIFDPSPSCKKTQSGCVAQRYFYLADIVLPLYLCPDLQLI